jgi:hypothetical protein
MGLPVSRVRFVLAQTEGEDSYAPPIPGFGRGRLVTSTTPACRSGTDEKVSGTRAGGYAETTQ